MSRISRAVFVGAGLCTLALGCSNRRLVEPIWEDLPFVQVVDGNPAAWKLDHFTLEIVALDRDSVRVTVAYGGGCEDHSFALLMTRGFIKTHPVQADLYLRHDGHGDACRALITQTVSFSLTPVQDHYEALFGDIDDVLLNLHAFDLTSYTQVLYPSGGG